MVLDVSKAKIGPFNLEAIHCMLTSILKAEEPIDQDKEHFWAIGCNSHHIQNIELVSLGTWTSTLATPREAFRLAIMKACPNIIFAHNHPSGIAKPSPKDINVTRVLWEAGNFLNVKVLCNLPNFSATLD